MKPPVLPEAVERYVEHLGLVWESQGLSRIAGRMVGLLTLHEAPLSLDDISGMLGVSKGSVSQDARQLAALGLLVKDAATKPGDRRDFYVIAPNLPIALISHRIAEIERLEMALEAAAALPETPSGVRARLERFGAFQRKVIASLRELSASLDCAPSDALAGVVHGSTTP